MDSVTGLVVDGNERYDYISYLKGFNGLKDVEFRNCEISSDDLLFLSNQKEYDRVAFINCSFEDVRLIQNINTRSLSLTDNKINNYEFVYNMLSIERLTIVGGIVDASNLSSLNKIEYLRLSHSRVDNIEMFSSNTLKYLFIDNTNIQDISFIRNYPNLELLSLSDNQELYNQEIIKEISKSIRIIRDSVIEMEVIQGE